METIQPRTLKGFRDFLPAEAGERKRVLTKIASTFETFGFLPLETPTLEYADVLTGKYGDEGEKLMYRFKDNGDRDVAMRYDLTVPLARVVAQYADIPKPFRRYQIAPVWRADNTQKGRYREFTQCDVDVVGSTSMLADAEVIIALTDVLESLGITEYQVRVNNRKVLNALLRAAGFAPEETADCIRILDKMDKIGAEGVSADLTERFGDLRTKALIALLPDGEKNETTDVRQWIERLRPQLEEFDEGKAGVHEFLHLITLVERSMGKKENNIKGDVLLARGLEYYTGTIFEIVLPKLTAFGSIAGGGRYDTLIGMFTGKDMPAVGGSIGIDRLMAAMQEMGMQPSVAATATAFVPLLDEALQDTVLQLVSELREAGIATEMAYEAEKLDKQLKYADRLHIPKVVLLGKKEQEAGTVTIKNLLSGEQVTVPRSDVLLALAKE